MSRTIVYVDGFNLYYRALKKRRHLRWLDLKALACQLLRPKDAIEAIKFYTARVSGRKDPNSPARQQTYLNALATVPEVQVFFGRFLDTKIWRPLVNPIATLSSQTVQVHDTEEKGSDVNLATHLVLDGCKNNYDLAVVVTNDSDLAEPVRVVKEELGKKVGILCPEETGVVQQLKSAATWVKYIRAAHLTSAQFLNRLEPDGRPPIERPAEWY
jgi:uncharacterized LabA/DUF88 family protein